jgi:hypothetical protein
MRKLLFLIVIFAGLSTYAQSPADTTKNWKFYGLGSLSINQASFSNWSPGGENSFSGTALAKLYADYAKGKSTLNTVLNMKYGMVKSGDEDLMKNEDLIELISQYNRKLSKVWEASAQLNFTTQFADGYNNPNDKNAVSMFMAPGYLTIAPGVTYQPVDYFHILISPATAKSVFVLDQDLADGGAFGVDGADTLENGDVVRGTGEKHKFKFGASVEFYIKKEIKTDLALESRLNIFYNYLQDNSIPDDAVPVDVNWQTFLNYKLNSWLSASFFIHLAYQPGDKFILTDESGLFKGVEPNDKLQVKQTMGLGLTYNF